MKAINLIWIIFIKITSARETWIDPHDMNIRVTNTLKKSDGLYKERCDNNDQNSSYLKKVINVIINMAKFDRESESYKGQIIINLSTEDYDFLKKFASSDIIDDFALRRLNTVLNNSLQKNIYDSYFFTISEQIFLFICNEHSAIVIGLLGAVYLLWKMEPHKYSMTTLFKIFFPLVYISDFVLRYLALIEEVEVDNYLIFKNNEQCDPNKLGWFDWLYDKFTGYCQQNERSLLLSRRAAIHVITPMKVLSQQFDVVVPVLKYFGEGFGSFMWALIGDMPFYVKPFVAIFAFILVIIIILMLGSYAFGISPRFNIFHFLQLEFLHKEHLTANRKSGQQEDSVSGENLRLLLNAKSSNTQRNNPTLVLSSGSTRLKNNTLTFKVKKKTKESSRKKLPKLMYLECKKDNGMHSGDMNKKDINPDEEQTNSLVETTHEDTKNSLPEIE